MSTIAVMAVSSSHCVCAKSATEWRCRLWPSESIRQKEAEHGTNGVNSFGCN